MWRLASLIGLGNTFGRMPFYNNTCVLDDLEEISNIFPEYRKKILIEHVNETEATFVEFGFSCCKMGNLKILQNAAAKKYLIISGYWLQDYRYFQESEDEIRKIFQFSEHLTRQMRTYAQHLFRMDPNSHKLCVHTRNGDFEKVYGSSLLHRPSDKQSVVQGIAQVYSREKAKWASKNISLVLFGDDRFFLETLQFDTEVFTKVHILKRQSRGEDMAFAVAFCNSYLITAPASTFAWWIGYLMSARAGTLIYFNAENLRLATDDLSYEGYTLNNYPPAWIPLKNYEIKKGGIQ